MPSTPLAWTVRFGLRDEAGVAELMSTTIPPMHLTKKPKLGTAPKQKASIQFTGAIEIESVLESGGAPFLSDTPSVGWSRLTNYSRAAGAL